MLVLNALALGVQDRLHASISYAGMSNKSESNGYGVISLSFYFPTTSSRKPLDSFVHCSKHRSKSFYSENKRWLVLNEGSKPPYHIAIVRICDRFVVQVRSPEAKLCTRVGRFKSLQVSKVRPICRKDILKILEIRLLDLSC